MFRQVELPCLALETAFLIICRREGEPYLHRTLYPFVSNICKNDICFEVDPHREPDPYKAESNLTKLIRTAKQMVDHICCSLSSIPM